jgi:hypothetical protein
MRIPDETVKILKVGALLIVASFFVGVGIGYFF